MPYYSAKPPRTARFFARNRQADLTPTTKPVALYGRLMLHEDGCISLSKSDSDRLAMRLLSKGVTLFSLYAGGSLAVLFGLHRVGHQFFTLVPGGGAVLTVAAVSAYLQSGPDCLILDPRHRTYTYQYGLPHFERLKTGTFDDIAALSVDSCLTHSDIKRDVFYHLRLHWGVRGRRPLSLCWFRGEKKAEAMREVLADKLGL